MNKRGQVTIFVIIALLIVVGIVLFFTLSKNNKTIESQEDYPEEILEVKNFVQNCLIETSENALIEVGSTGGYFSTLNYEYLSNGIPFYLKNNQNLIPTRDFIESELEYYIDNELFYCTIGMYQQFPELTFEEGEVISNVQIEDSELEVSLSYDLTITKEETSYQIKKYETTINSNLDKILYVANEVVSMHTEDPENIQLTALYDLGQQSEIYIDLIDYENHLLYSLTDYNTEINNGTYTWYFAIE